jgi:hypothetical protein
MTVRPPDVELIWRQVPFSRPAFDRLKDWQRHLERKEGRRLTNGEVLDRLILANPAPR